MRLLLITNDYPPKPGGIQSYLAHLIARFPGEALVVAPRDSRSGPEAGVVRAPWKFMWPTPRVLAWMRRVAVPFVPDVVLFGAPFPLPFLGPALRRRLRIPYGVIAHGAEITVPGAVPIVGRIMSDSLHRADVVFATSRHTTRAVEQLSRRDACELGAGVDLDAFRPTPHPRRAPTVIGTVGRFVPRKGHGTLIEAVAALRRRGRDVELLVVGGGRLERRLRRLAARLAVPARFEVDVPWDRLPQLYAAMDVFALPCRSRWLGHEAEGLGMVFLEAAASGLPVIAGDSGGAPETIEPERSGTVVRTRGDLVDALDALITDPARAAAMGACGRRRVEEHHGWDGVVARLVAGFEAVRDAPGRTQPKVAITSRAASRAR